MNNKGSKRGVLILTNPLDHEGGVVNYYNLVFKNFYSSEIQLMHFSVGSRSFFFYQKKLKKIVYAFYMFADICRFMSLMLTQRSIKIIQVSPSLTPVPLIRDGIFLILAKAFNKKAIVFYRGWKVGTLKTLQENKLFRYFFNRVFQTGTEQIVLANRFKSDLQSIFSENKNEILVMTTAIESSRLRRDVGVREYDQTRRVLYLGRLQQEKGVEDLVRAIIAIDSGKSNESFIFTIAGHEVKSGYRESLEHMLESAEIRRGVVTFTGRVEGERKFLLYAEHDIFVLPSYSEGCPNSVLEALGTGLFCVTTPVGALEEIIACERNGILVSPGNHQSIVDGLRSVSADSLSCGARKERALEAELKYDIANITGDLEKLYKRLLDA